MSRRRRKSPLRGVSNVGALLAAFEKDARNNGVKEMKDWWTREIEAEKVRQAEEEGHARRMMRLAQRTARAKRDITRHDPA